MTRASGFVPACLLFIATLTAGCADSAPTRGIVLLTLDTTRADRLGCYGYAEAETPNLDALAAGGVQFLEAQSPVPVTLPAHSTMFTGTYPPSHGVRYNGMFTLQDSSVTVAELLRDAGWSTAGVPASFPVASRTGINQGFQIYRDKFLEEHDPDERLTLTSERSAGEITDIGIELLKQSSGAPFFLWLHYWDAHYPYEPPFPYSSSHRDRPYDGEIAYMDREIGRLFEAIRDLGLWDETLIVVVGDHGEGLYEHNEKMHANLVYQTTLHVPLILKPPGSVGPRKIEEPVTLADIAPTLLDFAGVEGPKTDGVSLKPVVFGEAAPRRDLYFESLAGSLVYGWSRLDGIRRGPWKYIRSRSAELFDLDDDPSEGISVLDVEVERAADLERGLESMERQWQAADPGAAVAPTPLDPAELDALASLGYVGGVITEELEDAPDPRNLVHLELEAFAAREELGVRNFAGALKRCQRILDVDPNNRYALAMAGRASFGLGDHEGAVQFFGRALERYPESVEVRVQLGEVLIATGDLEGAIAIFRGGLEYTPEDAGLIYRLAAALYGVDRLEEALEIIDPIVDEPQNDFPAFRVLRAACRAKQGDDAAALEELKLAIAQGYREREVLETEPLLEPLRGVPGFDAAIEAIEEPPPEADDAGNDGS